MSFPVRAQRAVESGLSSINTFTAMTRGPRGGEGRCGGLALGVYAGWRSSLPVGSSEGSG